MMNKSNRLISLIREIVKQEVQKEVKAIFIKEGLKSLAEKSTLVEDNVLEVLPDKKPKPKKKVTYTKNAVLNDILNETANAGGMEEYPTMGGGAYDTSRMTELAGHGKSNQERKTVTRKNRSNVQR